MNKIVKYLNTKFLCLYYTALIKVNSNKKIVNTIIVNIVIIIIIKRRIEVVVSVISNNMYIVHAYRILPRWSLSQSFIYLSIILCPFRAYF